MANDKARARWPGLISDLTQEILSAKLQGLSGERIIKGPAERDKGDTRRSLLRFDQDVQTLSVRQGQVDQGYVGPAIFQMALGLVEFVGATQAKVRGASRTQHLRQTAGVNRIPIDQEYLNALAGHGTPRWLACDPLFSLKTRPERASLARGRKGCSCRPSELQNLELTRGSARSSMAVDEAVDM
jgi:hypothetical protein